MLPRAKILWLRASLKGKLQVIICNHMEEESKSISFVRVNLIFSVEMYSVIASKKPYKLMYA